MPAPDDGPVHIEAHSPDDSTIARQRAARAPGGAPTNEHLDEQFYEGDADPPLTTDDRHAAVALSRIDEHDEADGAPTEPNSPEALRAQAREDGLLD